MRTLIRFITKNAAGGTETNDRVVETDVITIGRATDQLLHLKDRRARLQHAEIKRVNGDVHITTQALAGVTVNGRSQRDARLAVGDVIEVGANILRVIEPEGGADFAITFELSPDARVEDLASEWSRPATSLLGFSKRQLSWFAVGAVALFAFVLPMLSIVHDGTASVMRASSLLPDDGLWLAGPVHSAHSSTATECGNCHVTLFERVPDSACLNCHAAARHVEADSPHAVLGTERCASCHLEHNEPPQLVKRHQGLCADCHADLPDDVGLDSATDFLDAHPEFRATLLQPLGDEWQVTRVPLANAANADRSNLKFDHAVHLDPAGIITPEGRRVVECAECHVPETGGAGMQPVQMDRHCSGCHTLSFDPDDPTRSVPHGDPPAVVQVLVEYYSARLLGDDPDAPAQRLRRPGQSLTRADRDRAAAEARVQALAVAEDLFERQACANCHEVTRSADGEVPWRVQPVRLTQTFFPHANFSHAAHDTEVTSCDGCHDASTSTSAGDVLIPGIGSCRDCHGSGVARRNSRSQIPSTCIMCHSFHFDAKGTP